MREDQEEKRQVCHGCLTGNYYLCRSFPGKAEAHAQREIEYRQMKAKRLERAGGGRPQVYRREDEVQ